jgi:hypothetical protein
MGTKHTPSGQIEIDRDIYLFKSPYSTHNKLVISAHGFYLPGIKFMPPVTVSFLSPHKTALIDPGTEMILRGETYPYERAPAGAVLHDYFLSKYKNDLYSDISRAINSSLCRYDLLTIRNRGTRMLEIRLSCVLSSLLKQGHRYHEIICAFCRSPRFGNEPEYKAKVNQKLRIQNIWRQIGID